MLAEALLYLVTPTGWKARRLGYLADSISLWSRANRCASAWAPHYEQCHAAVERAIEALPRRRKALVLGSGLARDIPLARLADAFDQVTLADIVHPLSTRLSVLGRRNVRLATVDLAAPAPAAPLGGWADDPALDLVVSANVLSQLPLLPAEWAEKAGRNAHDAGRAIVERHVAALRALPCRVVLLTDLEGIERDRSGKIVDRYDLLNGLRLPAPDATWDWHLAPMGEAAPDRQITHRAAAFVDFARVP